MKNEITNEQAATMKPSEVKAVCNMLIMAHEMLRQIGDGKNFPATVYVKNLNTIGDVVFHTIPFNGQ